MQPAAGSAGQQLSMQLAAGCAGQQLSMQPAAGAGMIYRRTGWPSRGGMPARLQLGRYCRLKHRLGCMLHLRPRRSRVVLAVLCTGRFSSLSSTLVEDAL
eukprot:351457-Chlamydomonas_euryale.AAC.6